MKKNMFMLVSLTLLIVLGLVFLADTKKETTGTPEAKTPSVEIKDGVQYVTINVKGGYSPRETTAKAGIPTKLIMRTSGTFDCSSSLVIRQLNYRKVLPQTGDEVIDLGTPVAGNPLQGVCGMGMYSFVVNFI
jgi:plastocyanin domain-containing protein